LFVAYVTPSLPIKDHEVSYSFIKDELRELDMSGHVKSCIFQVSYKKPLTTISQFSRMFSFNDSVQLIHAHFVVPYGFVANIIAQVLRKPLVITVHGFDILVSKEFGYGLNRFTLMKLLTESTLRKADKVIANSHCLKSECMKYGVPSSKIVVIPYGVNLHFFRPRTFDEVEKESPNFLRTLIKNKGERINILCAKRLEQVYGVEYLIKAVKILKIRRTKDFLLILVGGGKLLSRYRELVYRLGLVKEIVFIDMIPRSFMPLLYNISDFTVVPSIVEGFGLVVAESLACGRPVIGSSVGGIIDQILDGYNGFIVPPRDPLSLADRIETLIEDDSTRKRMSKNSRTYAEAHLDLKKRIFMILKVYDELISTKQASC